MLEAAIFDWDGVVVDSSDAHEKSWKQLADEAGYPWKDEYFHLGFGKRNAIIIPEIYQWTEDPEEIAALGDRKEALYREILVGSGLEPLPGALELFRELQAAGVPMAVGTSTPRENVETVLGIIGAEGFFEAIIASEDVSRGKPCPEVFLKGAQALGVEPANCVVFEDAVYGVEAGLEGGMKVVGLTTTHGKEHFREHPPHRIVRNLADVSLTFLKELWEEDR